MGAVIPKIKHKKRKNPQQLDLSLPLRTSNGRKLCNVCLNLRFQAKCGDRIEMGVNEQTDGKIKTVASHGYCCGKFECIVVDGQSSMCVRVAAQMPIYLVVYETVKHFVYELFWFLIKSL